MSVAVADVAPALTVTGPDTVLEENEFELTLAAGAGTNGAVRWTVSWGDGTSEEPPTVETFDSADGSTLTVSIGYEKRSTPYTITVTATDLVDSYTVTRQVTVLDALPEPTAAFLVDPAVFEEGQAVGIQLRGNDPGADPIDTWIVDWGDGEIETITGTGTAQTANHVYGFGSTGTSYTIQATAVPGRPAVRRQFTDRECGRCGTHSRHHRTFIHHRG